MFEAAFAYHWPPEQVERMTVDQAIWWRQLAGAHNEYLERERQTDGNL